MVENNTPQVNHGERRDFDDDEIDLLALLGALLDKRSTIIGITSIAFVFSVIYAIVATPIYQAGSMLQVEEKSSGLPGLEEFSGAFATSSSASTEIEIIKSRSVIGKAVDNLNLTVVATPKLAPFVGNYVFRRFVSTPAQPFAEPWFGLSNYAWGGERIVVTRFDVPDNLLNTPFTIIAGEQDSYNLTLPSRGITAQGKVGERLNLDKIQLFVSELAGRPGTEYTLTRRPRLSTVTGLQADLSASESGRQTGILRINYSHPIPAQAERIVDAITDAYVDQNVRRLSAEAENSLRFIKDQLPAVKADLRAAERALNQYQSETQSIDISAENRAVLSQVVELETRLQEMDLRRVELSRRFTGNHPNLKALEQQYDQVAADRNRLNMRIQGLPSTQQHFFSLRRDVEVANGVYELLLYKAQELEVAKASTVGNVRVIDTAVVDVTAPVAPKKSQIVLLTTLIGTVLGTVLVLLQRVLHRGIENPDEIEVLGVPVFASVPFSEEQERYNATVGDKKNRQKHRLYILADEDPTDSAVEMIRNLRTSLYFNLSEAKNKAVMVTGPSPGVGKSFVSVNLAAVSAKAGQKVMLIDGDLRRGYIHRYFAEHRGEGLAAYLAGRESAEGIIHESNIENLHVITRGQTPPNPSELLMHERLEQLVNEHLKDYDLIIIDTPPVLAVTDAAIIGRLVGNTLIVSRFEETCKRELLHTFDKLKRDDIHVTGAILNSVKKRLSNYYGYGYYGYNYSYNYKSQD